MSKQILTQIISAFQAKWNYTICIGAEIEFYLDNLADNREQIFADILATATRLKIPIDDIDEERGQHQYEIQFHHGYDPVLLADNIATLRQEISKLAQKYGAEASFLAKPKPKDYGNAMHFHLNLQNDQSENLFAKVDENNESEILLYSIAGMLSCMRESMVFFSASADSYARLAPHFEAPVNVSWGGNNRTTSLRIPNSPPQNRRVEHRLSSADSDPYQVIAAIIIGVDYGLMQKTLPPERIYGNADDEQYILPTLPSNLVKASSLFAEGKIVKPCLESYGWTA